MKSLVSRTTDTLTIYIEGDGFAWKTRFVPTMDPTPDDPVALKLALGDRHGSVAYLARPCQYTIDIDRSLCRPIYWTLARYSEQVVRSMDEGVSTLKAQYNARRVRLVGYSGGGVIAALLAARRNDVAQLITIASNLDIDYWTRLHGVTPLRDSLNPAKLKSLADVPQIHFVGADDKIVPRAVVESYLRSIGLDGGDSLHSIAKVDHQCCWPEIWPDLYQKWIVAR